MPLRLPRRAGTVTLRWPARAFAAAAGVVGTGALAVAGLPVTTFGVEVPEPPDPELGPGATFLVSGDRPPTYYDPQTSSPAVSDDGSVVGFAAGGDIHVRGTDTGQGPRIDVGGISTAPSLDAEGDLVAFSNAPFSLYGSSGGADVYVSDLSGEGPVNRRVTDVPGDLAYQRVPVCRPRLDPGEGGVEETMPCGPVLSGDGRTVAFGATLSVVAPDLQQTLGDEVSAPYLDGGRGLALVDFGDSGSTRTLTVTATGDRPVAFTRVAVTAGAGRFSVDTPAEGVPCQGTVLDPGGESACQVEVLVERRGGCATFFGTLTFDGPTPRSQTSVRLVADETQAGCQNTGGSPPTTEPPPPTESPSPIPSRAAACPAHPRPENPPQGVPDSGATVQTGNLFEVPVGRQRVYAQEISNYAGQSAAVRLFGGGCAFRLVQPRGSVPGPSGGPAPEPCVDGQPLPFYATCTAYVSLVPGAVATYAASVGLVNEGSGYPFKRYRVVGAGTRDVVVVRRDPSGTGTFTGPERPPARVVSIDQAGAVVDGTTPSVSADGRQVAFASTRSGRYPGTQVLVHDTDRDGDGSYQSGGTVLASVLGSGDVGLASWAGQPSLSGDGTRVAFLTVHEGEGEDAYVRVRDLTLGRTVVASAGPDGAFGNGRSYAPALSRDGGTVSYASSATNLLGDEIRCCTPAVYARDLAADFATDPESGPSPPDVPNEILSLPLTPSEGDELFEGTAGQPASSGDGGVVAFVSDGLLVPGAQATRQVYARARFPEPVVSPDRLEFPTQQVDTVGPSQSVTVSNLGPGPVRVSTALTGPFRVTDSCAGVSVHRGESCEIAVSFAPTEAGELVGTVTVTSDTFAWTGDVEIVGLAGVSVPLLFTVEPGALDFPATGIGKQSEPIVVTATNLGSEPMTLATALLTGIDDFTVTPDPETCVVIAPGSSCELATRFAPVALGDLAGQLQLVATIAGLPYTQDLAMTGTTEEPTLAYSPEVTQEGRVVFVSGEHFLPDVPVELTWDTGQVAAPVIVPDEEGSFSAPVVILKGRGPGIRQLTVSMPDVPDSGIEAPPLLVVLGSAQPPDFTSRN